MKDPKLAGFFREQRRRIREQLDPPRRVGLAKDGNPLADSPVTELSDSIDECVVTTKR